MAKYLRIASDLHLEGFSGRDPLTLAVDFLPHDDRDTESVLVLAGDISSDPGQLIGFIGAVMPRFHRTIFIPGNHEYYRHNYDAWNKTMQERFENYCPGLRFALGEVGMFAENGVRYIYTTLWGDGGPTLADQGAVGWYLNDFRLIKRDGHGDPNYRKIPRNFTVPDMIGIFKGQKATLDAWLKGPYDGKTVVITHHLPSRRLVSARFWPKDGSDGANGGFVGQCDDILAYDHAPSIWIHGHTHDTIDTQLWKTRIVCNPAGYRGEWNSPHNSFMTAENGKAVTVPKFIEL